MLIFALENTAEWRSVKAEEYPEDERNLKAKSQLEALAEAVGKVEPDDPLLLDLDGYWQHDKYEDYTQDFCKLEASFLRGVGFYQTFDSAEDLLGALIQEFRAGVH